MLPNDVIVLRNNEEVQEVFGGRLGGGKGRMGCPSQAEGPQHPEFESASDSRSNMHQNRQPGYIRSPKFDVLDVYGKLRR